MSGPFPNPDAVNTSDKRYTIVTDGAVPRAPEWLTKEAKKIYKKTAKKLAQLGIVASADEQILALFSMQMDRLIKLRTAAKDDDLKAQRLLNDLTAQTLSLSREIGLTPSSRAKMRIKAMEPDTDPLSELLDDES